MDQHIRYATVQCPDCMFYEAKYAPVDEPVVCADCGSLDVIVAWCRPHNWERYASRKQSYEVKEQVPIKYQRRY